MKTEYGAKIFDILNRRIEDEERAEKTRKRDKDDAAKEWAIKRYDRLVAECLECPPSWTIELALLRAVRPDEDEALGIGYLSDLLGIDLMKKAEVKRAIYPEEGPEYSLQVTARELRDLLKDS